MTSVDTSLWQQFEALRVSEEVRASEAIRCGSAKNHLLLKGTHGEPILLIATSPRQSPRAPIRLKHISIFFDTQYQVTSTLTDETSTAWFCKVACDPICTVLHRYFVELLVATANSFENELSQSATDEAVDALIELFRKLTAPPKKTISGLWAELLLIRASRNPSKLVDAWHISATDTFDFVLDKARIEVKGTERNTREHDFSLRQVRGGRPGDFIASIVLTSSGAGPSVLDLARDVASCVSLELQSKLWKGVLETLGSDAESAEEQKYDFAAAIASIALLPTEHVPAPAVHAEYQAFISEVRFRAQIGTACQQHAVTPSSVL